jgi:hypothetical protein
MSDPRSTDPLRRINLHGASARADAAGSIWTTLWTWLAAIAAVAVILAVVYGYSRSDLAGQPTGEAATTGSAPAAAPPTPLPASRMDDARAPAPPADDDP